MAPSPTCPSCGATLATPSTEGLCPRCLLAGAVATVSATDPADRAREAIAAAGEKLSYFGDYELLQKIAQGGMGVVYKARQVSLNRVVAVKMILAGELAGDTEVKRFQAEAEAAANLQHPNIVAIHEVGQHGGRHYFSMDYVEGKNLAELIQDQAPSPARAARYVLAMAGAIQYAHQRGILHRDLKPQNVLIDEFDQPRITDFGLARQIKRESNLTQTGVVMGSPSYMPPEQAAGRQELVGPASDVYSLGAVLYQLLTGRAPFAGKTPMETLMKVVEEEPKAPSKLSARVPRDLELICLKCLEKRPDRRYATARELAEELGRFLNNEPIRAQPAAGTRQLWSWGRRNPWTITGSISFVALAMFWLAYSLWVRSDHLVWEKLHPGQFHGVLPQWAPDPIGWIQIFWWALFYSIAVINIGDLLSGFRRNVRRRVLEGIPVPQRVSLFFGGVYLLVTLVTIAVGCWWINEYHWRRLAPDKLNPFSPAVLFVALAINVVFVWRCVLHLIEAIREYHFFMFLAPEASGRATRAALRANQEDAEEMQAGRAERDHPDYRPLHVVLLAFFGTAAATLVGGWIIQLITHWRWSILAAVSGYVVGLGVAKIAQHGPRTFRLAIWIVCPLVLAGLAQLLNRYLEGAFFITLTSVLAGSILGGAFVRMAPGEIYFVDDIGLKLGRSPSRKELMASAQAGDAEAQSKMGDAYSRGAGVPRDGAKALRWFLLAAEGGHVEAQYKAGQCFEFGRGTPIDLAKAAAWYVRAARQGDPAAQGRLGLMYWEGQGVARDLIEAYCWLELANPDGTADGRVDESETDLEREMTADQIAEGERRVEAFRPKKEGRG